MKRSKVNRATVQSPASHRGLVFDGGGVEGDENPNETSRTRMLDNLKIALFFSRMQCQMGKEKHD
jgi:hypothetical protein